MLDRMPPTARLIGIGWYFVVCIVGGIIGGLLLDKVADTDPWLTMTGLALGLVLAFYGGYQMLMDVLRPRSDKEDKEE